MTQVKKKKKSGGLRKSTDTLHRGMFTIKKFTGRKQRVIINIMLLAVFALKSWIFEAGQHRRVVLGQFRHCWSAQSSHWLRQVILITPREWKMWNF